MVRTLFIGLLFAVPLAGCSSIPPLCLPFSVPLAGCPSTPPFGADDQARLLLAEGEGTYQTEPAGQRSRAWRNAICESEQAAEQALEEQLRKLVTASWAESALTGGNGLPSLTEGDRERVVSGIMEQARILSGGERQPGVVQSYAGVRLAGDFAACLHEVGGDGVAEHCARLPEAEPIAGCEQLPEPPPLHYYLE